MGYDIHITRADEWFDSQSESITMDEWIAYIQSDPEMRLDGYAEATTPEGDTIRIESEGLAVWTAYSGHGVAGNMAWIDVFNGRITVKNPDREIRQKMFAIATKLNARVQGDDGELYDKTGESP